MLNQNRPAPEQGARTAETVQRYVDTAHLNPRRPLDQPSDFHHTLAGSGTIDRFREVSGFQKIGEIADTVIRNLAVASIQRLIKRADTCTNAGDRRTLVIAAARILRGANLTPNDLMRGRTA